MIPAAFDYIAPQSIDEALSALADHGDGAKVLAGGQSLLPLMKLRLANARLVVDLAKISGLSGIRRQEGDILIGALTTHYQMESSDLLKTNCPLLPQVARAIGDVQVRNRGTIGGNIVHADPAADSPAAMLALRAEFTLRGCNGDRVIDAERFFLGPMTTAIAPTEILTEIRVPAPSRRFASTYQKIAQQASGFAIVGVAVSLQCDAKGNCQEIGIGVTGLSDKAFRARAVEERLRGKKLTSKSVEESAAHVANGVEPLEDLHADAEFRAHLARVCTSRAIQHAARSLGASS